MCFVESLPNSTKVRLVVDRARWPRRLNLTGRSSDRDRNDGTHCRTGNNRT
jgi:hypothetical protein